MLALLQIQRWRANARNVSFRTIFRCLIHIINSFDKMTKFCCKSYYLEQHHSFLETYPFHSLGSNKFEWSNVRYVFIPDFVNFRKVRNTLCCFPINQLTSNTSQIERRFARDRTWKNNHSKWPLFLWRHCFHDKLFKYILFSLSFREGFRSVVVITSALHAEGRRFEPCRNQLFFFLCDILIQILPWIVLPNDLEHADKEKNILKPRSSFGRLELIWSGCTDTIMFFSLYLFYNIDIKMWNFSDVDIEPDIDFVMINTWRPCEIESSLISSKTCELRYIR